jgi:RNA polymerase sigma factor (sigma-70 family)
MSKKLSPSLFSDLLTAYYESHLNDNEFNAIHRPFQEIINKIAKKLDPVYQDHLISEGNIGLLKAIRTFSPQADRNKFLGYALRSIKNSMIDFLRAHADKHPMTEQFGEDVEQEGPAEQIVPRFTSTSSWSLEDSGDYYQNRIAPVEYVATASHPVVVSYQIDKRNPGKIGLTPIEVRMIDLDFQNYKTREIAEMFCMSQKQIRDRIKKIKKQIRQVYK